MRLGLALPLAASADEIRAQVALTVAAEDAGYGCVWVPEAYGSDAVSILATMAAATSRIGIGSGVLQIPARTPAMTAMTAAGLDAVSRGRFRLGLGVSGPQVSEGWHGVPFADPLGRMSEYVAIVRRVLSRRRVTADGPHFPLPLAGGQGKPLALALHTERDEIPIYLAGVGPKSVALAGRIADGWLGIFFDAGDGAGTAAPFLDAARAAGRDAAALDVVAQVPTALGADAAAAGMKVRPYAALYLGGMGSKKTNFYHGIATRMGYGEEADDVQRRFLSRDYEGAAAAVPQGFLQRTCLLGSDDDVAAGLQRLRAAGVTTAAIGPAAMPLSEQIATLRRVAEIASGAGVLDDEATA